ncbi:MAG: hypothetical protein IPN61_00945 [Bacteroidetes bacterium]|nr:hypothetical protein [Bacteroidota bacterium]
MIIDVDKENRIKIHSFLNSESNTYFSDKKLRKAMKETKVEEMKLRSFYFFPEFLDENIRKIKQKVIAKYTDKGYRDTRS